MSVIEQIADKTGNTNINEVILEILFSVLFEQSETDGLEDNSTEEKISILNDSMRDTVNYAEKCATIGHRGEAMSEYLKACSMAVELMSLLDLENPKNEIEILKILKQVILLLKKGSGYKNLPEGDFIIMGSANLFISFLVSTPTQIPIL